MTDADQHADIALDEGWSCDRSASRGRIVQLIDGLGRGGAERLLSLHIGELRRQGFDVRVVVLQEKDGNPEADRLRAHGVRVDLLQIDKVRRVDQFLSALRVLKTMNPDLIHAHLQFSILLAGLARRVHGIPTIATLHNYQRPEGFNSYNIRLWLMIRVLSGAIDTVICLSGKMREFFIDRGIPAARLQVLSNGIDLSPYKARASKTRTRLREELKIPQDAPLIITVAVLRPQKGIDQLFNVVQALGSDFPELRLMVVGEGPEKFHFEQLVSAAKLDDRVVFTGHREDVPDLLAMAEIFVLPTQDDALPTVVIEAMAASLPIVATRVGGLVDMIDDGVEGYLVAPGEVPALTEAIEDILNDDEKRVRMGKAARVRAEGDYALGGQIARLCNIYEDLIAQGPCHR